jgi:F-type H+-transporting ATPase subunit alpha
VMYAGTRGFLDKLPVKEIGRYEEELLRHLHAEKGSLLETIRKEKKLSDDTQAELKATLEAFTTHFA